MREESLRKETGGGAVLYQSEAPPKEMCQTGECKEGEGSKSVHLWLPTEFLLQSSSAGRAINGGRGLQGDGADSLV